MDGNLLTRALIQKEDGRFINVNAFVADAGFRERGFEVASFEWREMRTGEVKLDQETIVMGGVNAVKSALTQLGHVPPTAVDYPRGCEPFLKRRLWKTTWRAIRAMDWDTGSTPPVFVKPRHKHKAFTGLVVRRFSDLVRTARFEDDMELWASDPVNFVSEYRVFVLRNEIVGLKHYKGAPLVLPDVSVIQNLRAAVEDVPVAYGLDVGVTDNNQTLLIECNDGFALGGYGLSPIRYTELLLTRWEEMTGISSC